MRGCLRCFLGLILSAAALATETADPQLQSVERAFAQRFGNVTVSAVRRTPFADLYEIQLGTSLVYSNAQADYVLDGVLIHAATRENLTEARQHALAMEAVGALPLELAVKQVKGQPGEDGGRWIAIFEDPNCGYCKQLRRSLEELTNLTIYSFLYPILTPDSRDKARDIWCAADPGAALDAWMLRGTVPASTACEAPTDAVLALGQQLMIRGTPAIFFDDGSRINGAVPLGTLKAKLGAS